MKLFHKLSKNTASRKPTKTSSLQAKNYQTTSAVSKTLPGFQNSKQNSKSTNKVKSTSAILYFWINSVHGNKKHLKPKYSCTLFQVSFHQRSFFCCERLSASMARSLHLRFSLCTTSGSHPGPGGSRTAASCQPQA